MLSVGKNLAVALASAGILALYTVLRGNVEDIEGASVLYKAIWYLYFAGFGLIFVGACTAAVLTLRRF